MKPCKILIAWIALAVAPSVPALEVEFQFSLADFSGTIPVSRPEVYVDPEFQETYMGFGDLVRIFNPAGLETYQFVHDIKVGTILGVATDPEGDIYVLSRRPDLPPGGSPAWLTRYDYRGNPKGGFGLTGLPGPFAAFQPDRMIRRNESLFLVSSGQLLVVEASFTGKFRRGWTLRDRFRVEGEKPTDVVELGGFAVDPQGRFLFTIPTLFLAYRMDPEGNDPPEVWGRPGSSPGRFGVIGGIAADEDGRIYVGDSQRGVVLIFSPDLQFLKEFGSRWPPRPGSLVRPRDVLTANGGRLLVTQRANRGVSVFSVREE